MRACSNWLGRGVSPLGPGTQEAEAEQAERSGAGTRALDPLLLSPPGVNNMSGDEIGGQGGAPPDAAAYTPTVAPYNTPKTEEIWREANRGASTEPHPSLSSLVSDTAPAEQAVAGSSDQSVKLSPFKGSARQQSTARTRSGGTRWHEMALSRRPSLPPALAFPTFSAGGAGEGEAGEGNSEWGRDSEAGRDMMMSMESAVSFSTSVFVPDASGSCLVSLDGPCPRLSFVCTRAD